MAVIPNEGTTLAYSTTEGGTYTPVANLLTVKPPGGSVASVPTTNLSSTKKTYRPGKIPDGGEVTFRIQHDPSLASLTALIALLASPATRWWKVTYADGNTTPANDKFEGFITEWEFADAEDESNLEADITLQVTGPITRTVGIP